MHFLIHQKGLSKKKGSDQIKLKLWLIEMDDDIDLDLVSKYYSAMSYPNQIKVLRYLFYLKAAGKKNLSLDDIRGVLSCTGCESHLIIEILLTLVMNKGVRLEREKISVMIENLSSFDNADEVTTNRLSAFFYPCPGHLAVAANWSRSSYDVVRYGLVSKEQKNGIVYYAIEFYDSPIDQNGEEIDYADYEYVEHIKQAFLLNFEIAYTDELEPKYWIDTKNEIQLRAFMRLYSIDDYCDLFPDGLDCDPLHMRSNWKVSEEEEKGVLCSRSCFNAISPNERIPFTWCNKMPCTHSLRLFMTEDKWEKYKYMDFLRIMYSNELSKDQILAINDEVSGFINQLFKAQKDSASIQPSTHGSSDNYAEWSDDMSVITYREDYEEDEEMDNSALSSQLFDRPTYDRYNGSWAQDEMGYSDDDIDTIFDGDPDAYWNID